jgi:flagellar basal-body rod protein FlgB
MLRVARKTLMNWRSGCALAGWSFWRQYRQRGYPELQGADIDFGAELERAMASGNAFVGMATTSRRHLESRPSAAEEALLYRVPMQSGIDGNTVEMDVERVAFAENAVRMRFSIQKTAGEYKDMLKLYQDMRP